MLHSSVIFRSLFHIKNCLGHICSVFINYSLDFYCILCKGFYFFFLHTKIGVMKVEKSIQLDTDFCK